MKNKTNKINKIFTVLTLVLLCTLSLGVRIQADDPEEWEESGTILLDKVYYETKTRKLTVEITETSGEIAHEYELYMMIEGELADNIGQFMNLGKLLSILGIMTVDINDTSRIIINGGGKITIKDQELYFGSNEEVKAGTKVLIGVESLDENYNPSKSNLIELTIGEESAEAGAINVIETDPEPGNSQNTTPNNENSNTSSNGGSTSLLLVVGGIVILAAAGVGIALSKRKKDTAKPAVKTTRIIHRRTPEEETGDEGDFPSLEDKTVFVETEDEDLIKVLKNRHYLEVVQNEEDEETDEMPDPDETAADSEPHLYICDVKDEGRLGDLLEKKKDSLEKVPLGLVLPEDLINRIKDKLEKLKEEKQIVGYVPFKADKNDIMIRLILPILKPDLKSDASLENIGKVCDLLGIEGVSTVISTFISGRDIKSTIEDGDLGFTGTATIISDVASILGMDTVASVAGLVGDVDSISTGTDSEAGAYEKKNAVLGAKDIVDVITDLADKA